MSRPWASVSCRSARPSGLTDQMSPWVLSVTHEGAEGDAALLALVRRPRGRHRIEGEQGGGGQDCHGSHGRGPLGFPDDARRAGATRLCPVGRSPVESRSQGGRGLAARRDGHQGRPHARAGRVRACPDDHESSSATTPMSDAQRHTVGRSTPPAAERPVTSSRTSLTPWAIESISSQAFRSPAASAARRNRSRRTRGRAAPRRRRTCRWRQPPSRPPRRQRRWHGRSPDGRPHDVHPSVVQ